eukprot:7523020-Pyramimonas_sp.AAC.1
MRYHPADADMREGAVGASAVREIREACRRRQRLNRGVGRGRVAGGSQAGRGWVASGRGWAAGWVA